MSAPLPTPYTSPMAGLVNTLLILHNTAAEKRIAELEELLAAERKLNLELVKAADTSRNFKASVDAGYIDLDSWRA